MNYQSKLRFDREYLVLNTPAVIKVLNGDLTVLEDVKKAPCNLKFNTVSSIVTMCEKMYLQFLVATTVSDVKAETIFIYDNYDELESVIKFARQGSVRDLSLTSTGHNAGEIYHLPYEIGIAKGGVTLSGYLIKEYAYKESQVLPILTQNADFKSFQQEMQIAENKFTVFVKYFMGVKNGFKICED